MADKSTLLSFLGLRKAGGEDIELPNESGRTDPRLKKPDVGGAFKKALEGYKILTDKTDRLKKDSAKDK